jgi:hypothetical protein
MFEKPSNYLFNNKICPNMEKVVCSLQGVLAEAKNGDELFCEEKFHVANALKVP